jgi:hypothetical protein
MGINLPGNRHPIAIGCGKAFSADEAIFIARITYMIDCFVVPPRNDDLFLGVCH